MERLRTIQSREQAIAHFIENCPFEHPEMELIVVPGSHNNQTFGNCSDLDITTVLSPENSRVIDTDGILLLSDQIRIWADRVSLTTQVAPVIVATIRLEEAQIQMAKSICHGQEVLPIHWLFNPSIDFLAANEPPALARGILKGHVIQGNSALCLDKLNNTDPDNVRCVRGLDWLTDSLRIMLANCSKDGVSIRQPAEFLIQNASHNLHWFWKWNIIVPRAKKVTGKDDIGWPNALDIIKQANPDLAEIFIEVHNTRHEGGNGKVDKIVELHRQTFLLWPTLIK